MYKRQLSRAELTDWVMAEPGPRLVIMNTVQSAAVIADDICRKYGRECVEHLSTALMPEDRAETIKVVKRRLENPVDTNWVLVATSCVEAGFHSELDSENWLLFCHCCRQRAELTETDFTEMLRCGVSVCRMIQC